MLKYVMSGLAALALAFPQPAFANFKTGNDLYAECTTMPSAATFYQRDAACRGFIVGVVDSIQTIQSLNDITICIPAGVTAGQIQEIVTAHLRRNPASRHEAASDIIFYVMVNNFGCRYPVSR